MGNWKLAAVLAVAMTGLGGCAMGPVSPQQRANADLETNPRPHPPARTVYLPGDNGNNPLKCYQDGPNTFCNRSN
jgi:hypothetical protein